MEFEADMPYLPVATRSALICTTIALASCGGGNGGGTQSESTASPTSQETSNPSSEPAFTCKLVQKTYVENAPSFEPLVGFNTDNDIADSATRTEMLANISYSQWGGYYESSPLRLELWAVPSTGSTIGPSGISGHLIYGQQVVMTGGSGPNHDQMQSGSMVTAYFSGTGVNPPAGDYCIVLALKMKSIPTFSCPSAPDGYCLRSWTQFTTGHRIR